MDRRQNSRFPYRLIGVHLLAIHAFAGTSPAPAPAPSRRFALFADPHFQRGFHLSYPTTAHGRKAAATLDLGRPGNAPVWRLCQWGTKYTLAGVQPVRNPAGDVTYENAAKRVVVGGKRSNNRDLVLAIRGSAEYGTRPREHGEVWPHLLVEQDTDSVFPLSHLEELRVQCRLRLVSFEDHLEKSADPSRHAAQFQLFFIVKNVKKGSKDFRNFFWFGLPFFDNRFPFPHAHRAQDAGKDDATGKYIYSVAGKDVLPAPLLPGKVITIDKDVLPHIKAGARDAVERGFLHSADPADYAVVNMNLGWEIPGTYDAAVLIRDLDVIALVRAGRRPGTMSGTQKQHP